MDLPGGIFGLPEGENSHDMHSSMNEHTDSVLLTPGHSHDTNNE